VINAEGEFQASEKLSQAAEVIARHPIAYQLRLLQTMTEVAAEKNSTLVLPIPVELFRPFMDAVRSMEEKAAGDGGTTARLPEGGGTKPASGSPEA
jgi:hypothetical protein